tara:strand:+ start:789 stop:1046 length:258 start_codon:yes stop_codon:yes gene_type:complete
MVELRKKLKVGPKGQVVIPKTFRELKGISKGSNVIMEIHQDELIIKPVEKDPIKVFEEIAKKTNFKGYSKRDFGEEIEKRWKKSI